MSVCRRVILRQVCGHVQGRYPSNCLGEGGAESNLGVCQVEELEELNEELGGEIEGVKCCMPVMEYNAAPGKMIHMTSCINLRNTALSAELSK